MKTNSINQFQDPKLSEKITPQIIHTSYGDIEYVDIGSGDVILCLHGAMGGYDQSLILGQTLGSKNYRYIAVSRPGYLGTPLSSGKSPKEQADLIAELLSLLNIKSVIVCAVSGGGPIALAFAIYHKNICNALVLASVNAQKSNTKIPFYFKIIMKLAQFKFFTNFIKKKKLENPLKTVEEAIKDKNNLQRILSDNETLTLFTTMLMSTYTEMGKRLEGTANDISIMGQYSLPLHEITLPTMTIHGTADTIVTVNNAKIFQEKIPQVETLIIDDGEHVSIFTHRKIVQEKIDLFLKNITFLQNNHR